ncbi:MAG: hypothetical protein IKN07_12165, partial [Lachnospiraceae bacterium]|nr:hypothetical protein [Lachnospiraceae bacterium]
MDGTAAAHFFKHIDRSPGITLRIWSNGKACETDLPNRLIPELFRVYTLFLQFLDRIHYKR